jgi:O-methyltransferase
MKIFKKIVRSTLRRFGYAILRVPAGEGYADRAGGVDAAEPYGKYLADLQLSAVIRDIHSRDVVEIEELYRHFVFPDLPRNDRRAALLHNLIGTTIGEAVYIIEHLHRGMSGPGDICEFGVAQGATSRLLASEIMTTDRRLWLFDSFAGLPAPGPEDRLIDDIFKLGAMSKYQGTMASPESEVLQKLEGIGFPPARTRVKKGWIKDTIKAADLPRQIAFAYIDFDFYEPIKDALEFVAERIPVDGRIVVDDYGFFSEGAQLAVDQFVQRGGGQFKFELPLPFAGHFCVLTKVA